jgi:hypothetical protein
VENVRAGQTALFHGRNHRCEADVALKFTTKFLFNNKIEMEYIFESQNSANIIWQ